jgi:hypothetical protein
MYIKGYLKKALITLHRSASEHQTLMMGRLLSEVVKNKKNIHSLSDVEFKAFSQWGDDGIVQWLLSNLNFPNNTFVEFGVGDYRESNTRFLMMNNNWSGLVMDASKSNISQIVNSEYYWRYNLLARAAFIDTDNVNDLIASSGFEADVGILHIDLDGNDYWIWDALRVISPLVVILEYNSIFGVERALTVPYNKSFWRTDAHYSNLYYGASLPALYQLSLKKGYRFIGCNSAGNNAYFIREDKLNGIVKETSLLDGYVLSKFRESRDKKGRLTHLAGDDRLHSIRGLPVYNINTNQIEDL